MHLWIDLPKSLDEAPTDITLASVLETALEDATVNAPQMADILRESFQEDVALEMLREKAAELVSAGETMADNATSTFIAALQAMRVLRLGSGPKEDAIVVLNPTYTNAAIGPASIGADDRFRLSRFAHFRRDGTEMIAERPMSGYRVTLRTSTMAAAKLMSLLTMGATIADMARARIPKNQQKEICTLLSAAGIVDIEDENGALPEDLDPVLQQWEPHDLVFHERSRIGYHDQPVGGTFRFKGKLFAQPALHDEPTHLGRVPLLVPDLALMATTDPSLIAATESRSSLRPQARRPLSLPELGVFLYRTARIKSVFDTELGGFTQRPYPSGGGAYESEIYITAQNVYGLRPGFYYYAAASHELLLLREWDEDCAALVQDALVAMAMSSTPDALLTFGCRFQRMQWKYSGMAYATVLKTTGAAYMAFYLAANAMGLSPCGLGLGNIATFARITGQDPYFEGSIGEFALSGPGV